MSLWPENTSKPISVFAPPTASILIYSKVRNSNAVRVQLPGTITYMGDNTWELMASFTLGEYILTVVVDNNPNYYGLSVKTLAEVNLTINQTTIQNDINNLSNKVTTNNSWKAIS